MGLTARSIVQRAPRAGSRFVYRAFLAGVVLAFASAGAAGSPENGAQQAKAIRKGTAHDALYDLAFEGRSGIAVGGFGTVLTTVDGGQSWRPEWSAPNGEALFGVAQRAGRCVIVGQKGTVFSADDCKQWKQSPPVTVARLIAVSMNRNGVVYAVGAFGTVLKSVDWGAVWTPLSIDWTHITEQGAEPHLYGVKVSDDGSVTLVGEFELVLRSSDGGAQWKVLHKGERSLFGLYMLDKGTGYAVGQSGAVIRTSDGGETWRSLDSGTSAILTGIFATQSGEVVATGINTIVSSRDDGTSWSAVKSTLVNSGWHQAVAASEDVNGKRRLLTVGSGGLILELNN